MKKLILASQSPRRRELLEKCGLPFICEPADIDETIAEGNDLSEEIKRLSRRKAEAVLALHPDAVVIGSDTIVAIDGKVLGKPKDRNEAREMLQMLSGNTHQVITGLCVISSSRCFQDVSVSHVTFAPLSADEIDAYVNSGECDDKAGAYAIQGGAGRFITNIDGDYYAIMGLPLNSVYEELKKISLY
ncbi:MAG: septum formation inhibitor Maf [Erysipelotrichaceae bacterium]|nr:septum formation inhibitor Maf [Erysipelotrichaceae bacterium]